MRNDAIVMIDLHGLSVKETKELLALRFKTAREENIGELYIITGRGNHVAADGNRGVLKRILPRLLKPYDSIAEVNAEIGCYRVKLKKHPEMSERPSPTVNPIMTAVREDEQEKFFQFLEQQAAVNDSTAILTLANLHLMGAGKFNDKKQVIPLLERAAELGSITAKLELATLYFDNQGIVPCNYRKGLGLLNERAVENHPLAQLFLGRCYFLGQGVKQSDEKAKLYIKQSADNGCSVAQFNLAYSYLNGHFTEENDDLAVKYFSMAAEQGHTRAKVYLARCYVGGNGVAIDYEKAFAYYKEAAEDDDVFALYQTGRCYLVGRGVKQDGIQAFNYFLRAAEFGDADSQAIVAEMLIFKKDGLSDLAEGMKWLEKALSQKNEHAYFVKSLIYKHGRGIPADFKERMKYLELAAIGEQAQAQFELGMELIAGVHIAKNNIQGLAWIKKSAESKRFPPAIDMQKYIDEAVERGLDPATIIQNMLREERERPGREGNFYSLFNQSKLAAVEAARLKTLLAKYKASKDMHLPTPETALRRAAALGLIEDARFLVKQIENVNSQDANPGLKRTALHWAIIKGHTEVAEMLLAAGASFDIADATGKTVWNYADESGSKETRELLTRCKARTLS